MTGPARIPVLLVGLLLVASAPAAPSDDPGWRAEVQAWIDRVASSRPLTVGEFNRWQGTKDESETQFEELECQIHGWEKERCVAFMKGRESQGDSAPSLFYAWLKRRLCSDCPVFIKSYKKSRLSTPNSDHVSVLVSFGDHGVQLAWFSDPAQVNLVGRLPVVAIDGNSLQKEMQREIDKHK